MLMGIGFMNNKVNYIFIIISVLLVACRDQQKQSAFQVVSSAGSDSLRQLLVDAEGNPILFGEWGLGLMNEEVGLRIVKLNASNQQTKWAVQWLRAEVPQACGADLLSNGDLICVGDTGRPNNNAQRKLFMARFDPVGNLVFESDIKWTFPVWKGTKMCITQSQELMLAIHDGGGFAGKWMLLRCDLQGNVIGNPIQAPAFPVSLDRYHCHVSEIKQGPDGDIYVISTIHGIDKKTKLESHVGWICRFSSQGQLKASKVLMQGLACRPSSISFTQNNIWVSGTVANVGSQIDDIFCQVYNTQLDSVNFATAGGIREEGLFRDKLLVYSVSADEAGVMVLSLTKSYHLGNPLLLLNRFEANKTEAVSEGIVGGYLGEFSPAGVKKNKYGGYWLAGTSNAWFNGKNASDWVLFRADESGNLLDY